MDIQAVTLEGRRVRVRGDGDAVTRRRAAERWIWVGSGSEGASGRGGEGAIWVCIVSFAEFGVFVQDCAGLCMWGEIRLRIKLNRRSQFCLWNQRVDLDFGRMAGGWGRCGMRRADFPDLCNIS